MLWIALHLPDLSLQAATRGLLPQIPVAITATSGNRTLIHAGNPAARQAGVQPGITAAAARAFIGELVLLPRDLTRERDALERIALCALQFTPGVSIIRDCIVLDVESSLTLFGGLGKLCGALRQNLRDLGYHATLGVAPTPLAAELFALAHAHGIEARACMDPALLPGRLRPLPAALLPWDDATTQTLSVLGLKTLGQLFDLPRDGLLRRFGFECARDLERITGALPDPRAPHTAPERFRTAFDLAAEIDDLTICLHVIELLLAEAQGFLAARGAATNTLQLTLRHGHQLTTRHEIGSSLPQRDARQWQVLVREQLQRRPLPAPATAIELAIGTLCEYVPPPSGWLPDPRAQTEDRLRLLDRLAARLGPGKVCTLAPRAEHRPEHAWTSTAAPDPGNAGKAARAAGAVHSAGVVSAVGAASATGAARGKPPCTAQSPHARPRPAWLLERPRALITRDAQPLHHGPLTLLAGPERIQSGWWDNLPVARDYFVARNPLGETCWIYRELSASRRWFLHGVFG